jgi:hypothetical protein
MRDLPGLLLIVLGVGLLLSAAIKRRARMRAAEPAGAIRPEFVAMGQMMRPLLLFAVALIAVKSVVFYLLFDGGRWLSPLTFGGFMFVLAAYAAWLILVLRPPLTRTSSEAAAPVGRQAQVGHQAEA